LKVTEPETTHPYNRLGRLIVAALIAYTGGIGVEYALKRYVPEEVDPYWSDLGEQLLRVQYERMEQRRQSQTQ